MLDLIYLALSMAPLTRHSIYPSAHSSVAAAGSRCTVSTPPSSAADPPKIIDADRSISRSHKTKGITYLATSSITEIIEPPRPFQLASFTRATKPLRGSGGRSDQAREGTIGIGSMATDRGSCRPTPAPASAVQNVRSAAFDATYRPERAARSLAGDQRARRP